MSDRLKITIPNHLSYVPVALANVREVARMSGFARAGSEELELAVEEAVTNVMKHAYDREENETFDLILERIPGGIKVVVKEMGIPFDPRQIPKYAKAADETAAAAPGMGVYLMQSMVDECSFENLGPAGKETRLVKYLAGTPPQPGPEPGAAPEPEVIKEKVAYTVRRMADEEAIEVSRCAYKSHGYSFFDDHIYYPDRLVEMNRSGEMVSYVAVRESGEFMGHAALLFQYPEDTIAELTFVFVNVEYRGQGAFNRLIELLFKEPPSRPLDGIYAYAVANHVFTQKATVRYGINDCGILLATSPAGWKFKGIPGDPTQRISVVLSFKYMNPPRRLTLYPPPHHVEMIGKLYANLGAEHDFAVPEGGMPGLFGEPDIRTGVNEAESCAEIFVARYGADPVREVKRLLRKFCLQKIAAINLFLNMEDPATCHLTAEFEKMGFFFAGVLPRARVGDTLMLQYLNNVDFDYTKVSAYTDMAKEILQYIRAHDPNESI